MPVAAAERSEVIELAVFVPLELAPKAVVLKVKVDSTASAEVVMSIVPGPAPASHKSQIASKAASSVAFGKVKAILFP